MRLTHFALTEETLLHELAKNTQPLKQFKKRIPAELFQALEGNNRCPHLKNSLEKINRDELATITPKITPVTDWDMSNAHAKWDALNGSYGYFTSDAFFNLFKQIAAPVRNMVALFEPQHFANDDMAYDYAYKLMALFVDPKDPRTQTLDAVAQATENLFIKRDKTTRHPFHDTLLDLHIPRLVDITYKDRKGWCAFIKKEGAQALPFLSEAKKIEDKNHGKAPLNLKEAQRISLLCQYTRAAEDAPFSKLCHDFKVSEQNFDQCLDYMASGWPKKTTDSIPDILVEGEGPAIGYCWVKLPTDDKRALILGRITGCCQSIGDASDECVRDAVSRSDNGLYVLLKMKNAVGKPNPPLINGKINDKQYEIVGESYVWRSISGNICLDSIECSQNRVSDAVLQAILSNFAQKLFSKNPDIKRVTVGAGGGTPQTLFAPIEIAEKMRQGYAYHDANKQFLIAKKPTSMNTEQIATLNTLLKKKPAAFCECIHYLNDYSPYAQLLAS